MRVNAEAQLNTTQVKLLHFQNRNVSDRDMFTRFHSSFKLRAPDQCLEKHRSNLFGEKTSFKVHRFRWRRSRNGYLSKVGRRDSAGWAVRSCWIQTALWPDFTRSEATNAPLACSASHIRTCLQNKSTAGYLCMPVAHFVSFTSRMSKRKNNNNYLATIKTDQ